MPAIDGERGTVDWEDDFIVGLVNRGLAEGLTAKEAQGWAVGWIIGYIKAQRSCVRKVLYARNLEPTVEQIVEVLFCTDQATLDRWLDRSLTATTAAEVFAN